MRPLSLFACLFLTLAATTVAAQKDKAKEPDEKLFNGRTIAAWSADVADKTKTVGERRGAAIALARAGASAYPAVKALTKALEDDDQTVRFHALQALGNVGTSARSAVPAVMKILRKAEPLSQTAAGTLGKLGKDAVEPLTKALSDDENPQVRRLAGVGLALLGPQASSASGALAKALGDDSFRVRRIAAEALRLVEPDAKDVLAALVKSLRTERDADVCASVAIAAGKLGKPALAELTKLLADDNADARYHATAAIREMGGEAQSAVKPLVMALRDKDEDVRANAALALGGIGEPAVPTLAESLSDKDADVRRGAATGLAQVGPRAKKAVGALVKALKDDAARIEAIRALGLIGDDEAVKPLTALLKDKDADVRRASAVALGEIGTKAGSAAETLAALMSDAERPVRESATVALLRIGKESVGPLVKVLKAEKAEETKVLALVALGAIGPAAEAAVDTIAAALKDEAIDVRYYAARALGRMGDKAKKAVKALKEATKDADANVSKAAESALKEIEG